jgi:hypothetical protein
MSAGIRFAAACNHLVERAALAELRIKLLAEFAGSAGPRRVKPVDDGASDVFHEENS